ncbi:MAG: hypothetical protein JWM82_721 [Myxococcales bacterium]|jgi:uncharacterized protein YbjT (DUF2867 family)|nr:hypothetical protein [Myxococcales bacterium]
MNAPRRRSRSSGLVFALVLVAGATGACSRAHLTPTHGRAYREVFATQDANPNRSTAKSVHGLDSQEAAIISGSYRRALSPQAAANGQSQQLLTTSTTAGGSGSAMPAPSVPGN